MPSRWKAGAAASLPEAGYLPQQLPPAEGMTVRETGGDWSLPVAWRAGALWCGRLRKKVEEAIPLVGLKPLAHRLVDSLWRRTSAGVDRHAGGEDSRCLLSYEPTSALDIAHQVDACWRWCTV